MAKAGTDPIGVGPRRGPFPTEAAWGRPGPALPKFRVLLRRQRQVSNPVFPPRTQGSDCRHHLGQSLSRTLDWVL